MKELIRSMSIGMAMVALAITGFVLVVRPGESSLQLGAQADSHTVVGRPDPGNWSIPFLGSGVRVSSPESERSNLAFDPRIPAKLGTPESFFVNNRTHPDKINHQIAWVFAHSSLGRFHVMEQINPATTQSDLEALVKYNDAPGSEGRIEIVTIRSGLRAVLIQGPVANSIVWLEDGIRFDVLGPTATFTRANILQAVERI